MPLVFGDVRKILAQYAARGGKAASSEDVRLFAHEVLQHLLFSGAYGSYRTFKFTAVRGVITLPAEIETPLKVKIGAEVGAVWDKWFDFNAKFDLEHDSTCLPGTALREIANEYPTVYDLPGSGSLVGVQCECCEDEDASVIVSGKDPKGREIYTVHKGERIAGEYLSIKSGNIQISQQTFKIITAVKKTVTKGYVELYWVDPAFDRKGFLSSYSPYEMLPSYRRVKLQTQCPNFARVEVLARIRLKPFYADTERVPFDNIVLIKTAAQSRNAANNSDNQTAQFKDGLMQDLATRENVYKNPNTGTPVAVTGPTAIPIRSIQSARRSFGWRRY